MRRVSISLVVAALSAGGVLYSTVGASAQPIAHASAPTVVLSASTALTNSQTIQVSGSGFTPSDQVYVIECYAAATNQSGCDTNGATPATIDTSGNLPSTNFTVSTGQIGSPGNGGTCGTSASDLSSCVIVVANITGADRGVAPITFAQPVVTSTTLAPKPPKKHVPRQILVHPKAGLRNGQSVRVTGRGFAAGTHYVIQCLVGARTQAQCDMNYYRSVTVGANGAFSTIFVVHALTIGHFACGTKANNLSRCEIFVATPTRTDVAISRITFRRP